MIVIDASALVDCAMASIESKAIDSDAGWLHCFVMAKVAEETMPDQREVEQARRELEARPPGTPMTWEEAMSYVRRLGLKTPDGWTSADIIRELRGPLPEDDPEYQRFLESGKIPPRSAEDQEAIEAVRRELDALPEGAHLSNAEVFALIRRLPPMHEGFSSADVIREMRGPLPEDDPDFPDEYRR